MEALTVIGVNKKWLVKWQIRISNTVHRSEVTKSGQLNGSSGSLTAIGVTKSDWFNSRTEHLTQDMGVIKSGCLNGSPESLAHFIWGDKKVAA